MTKESIMNLEHTKLIGLAGKAGSGKDTAGAALIKAGFFHYFFAKPMKEGVKELLGWTDAHVYGELKDVVDPRYGFSPRHALQTLGTDWGRNMLAEDVWLTRARIHIAELRAKHSMCNVVITDVRFDNEAELIHELGGIVINVTRPTNDLQVSTHASEAGLAPSLIDYTLVNDRAIEALHSSVLDVADYHNTIAPAQ